MQLKSRHVPVHETHSAKVKKNPNDIYDPVAEPHSTRLDRPSDRSYACKYERRKAEHANSRGTRDAYKLSPAYRGMPEARTATSVGCEMTWSINPYSCASCADMKKSRSVSSIIVSSDLSQNSAR